MAYLTLTNLELNTEQQRANLDSYITSEITAGNTDGIKITVTREDVTTADQTPMSLAQRSWKDSVSANAFISYINSLGATVNYVAVVNPL